MRGVGHDLLQGTHLEEKALDELLKSLKMDTQNIACVISENTGKTEKEIMKAMYQGTVLNPEQAVTFGLVHEIKAELFPINTRVIAIS
jgi:ATP-dependent protease ClpP protease subunit